MRIDFHVHTICSPDASVTPEELIKKAKTLNIIPAITDHNTTACWKEFRGKIDFIPGEEVLTQQGDLIALFIQEPLPKGIDGFEAIDRIHEQGGIAYLPHPFDITRYGAKELITEVDIVEVFNSRSFPWDNFLAERKAKELGKLMGCGSDAHFIDEFGKTYVETDEISLTPSSLLKALSKGRVVGAYNLHKRLVRRFLGAFMKS